MLASARTQRRVRADELASAQTRAASVQTYSLPPSPLSYPAQTQSVRADKFPPSLPSPPLPSPPLPPAPLLPRANAVCCPCGRAASALARTLEIFNFFSVFGFQFPRSLRSPSSAGFARKATRRRFFRPSSPSYPSKLYSSLGWLNSKVPKPFSPFILRLIDVDGF
jgi:hypothetical protein